MPIFRDDLGIDTATDADIANAFVERKSTFGEFAGAVAGDAWQYSLGGLWQGASELGTPTKFDAEGNINPLYESGVLQPPEGKAEHGFTQEEFKQRVGKRDIPFDPFADEQKTNALIDQHDQVTYRNFVMEQRRAGFWDKASAFAINIGMGALDPINYIPLFGEAAWAGRAVKAGERAAFIGKAMGRAAIENAVTTAAMEPLYYARDAAIGQDMSFAEAAQDVLYAAAFGSVISGPMAWFHSRGGARITPDVSPEGDVTAHVEDATKIVESSVEPHRVLLQPTEKEMVDTALDLHMAIDDIVSSRPVDVGERIARNLDKAQADFIAERMRRQVRSTGETGEVIRDADVRLDKERVQGIADERRSTAEREKFDKDYPSVAKPSEFQLNGRDESVLDGSNMFEAEAYRRDARERNANGGPKDRIYPTVSKDNGMMGVRALAEQPRGKPGLTVEKGPDGQPTLAVMRAADGSPVGIRLFGPDSEGRTTPQGTYVAEKFRHQGIARALLDATSERTPKGDAIARAGDHTADGARMLNAWRASAPNLDAKPAVPGEVPRGEATAPMPSREPGPHKAVSDPMKATPDPDPRPEIEAIVKEPEPDDPLEAIKDYPELASYEKAANENRVNADDAAEVRAAEVKMAEAEDFEKAFEKAVSCYVGGLAA